MNVWGKTCFKNRIFCEDKGWSFVTKGHQTQWRVALLGFDRTGHLNVPLFR